MLETLIRKCMSPHDSLRQVLRGEVWFEQVLEPLIRAALAQVAAELPDAQIDAALAALVDSEREALQARFFDGLSLSEMQERLHFSSRDRARTVEARAILHLRTALRGGKQSD